MSEPIIHHNGVYNLYSDRADAALFTHGATLEQLTAYIEHQYGQQGLDALPERLKRAHATGTSSVVSRSLADEICTNRAGPGESRLSEEEFIRRFLTLPVKDKPAAEEPDPKAAKREDGATRVWTIQLGKWRLAKAQDIPLLNITAMSGVQAFAPDIELVMLYKRGLFGEADYTRAYRDRMAESRLLFPETWASMLQNKPKLALACYCKAGAFCHRHIFLKLMTAYLREEGQDVIYEGELT